VQDAVYVLPYHVFPPNGRLTICQFVLVLDGNPRDAHVFIVIFPAFATACVGSQASREGRYVGMEGAFVSTDNVIRRSRRATGTPSNKPGKTGHRPPVIGGCNEQLL